MALIDNLVSYWKLDEASGDALDAHGSNTLTEHGTGGVGTAAGIINNARSFVVADSDYFDHTDNTDLSTGDIDFTFAGWLKLTSDLTQQTFVSKGDWGIGGEYSIVWNAFTWKLEVCSGSGFANYTVLNDNSITYVSGVWYYLIWWHDSVNNLIGIAVNDATPVTTAYSAGVWDGTGSFNIGRQTGNGRHMDGLIDEVGFWKRMLSPSERTALYNSGAGFAYPFTSTPASLPRQSLFVRQAVNRASTY